MEVFSISVNYNIEVNAWCDVFSRLVAVGTRFVLIFSAVHYVFSCVQCVLLVDWRCFANVLWCFEFHIAPTFFRCRSVQSETCTYLTVRIHNLQN